MLVIARKVGQSLLIGEEIEITVSVVRGDQVRLAIRAPRSVSITRKEVVDQIKSGNITALQSADNLLELLAPAGRTAAQQPAPRFDGPEST